MNEAIVIIIPEDCPPDITDNCNDLLNSNINVKIEERALGAVAGIEWTLPTLVIAYLLKPYFDGFLQEAGKDSYLSVKSILKKLIAKSHEIKAKYITAQQSFNKLSIKYDQSISISVKAKLHPSLTITVLFNEELIDSEMDDALEGMFEMLHTLFNELQKESNSIEKEHNIIDLYLIADNSTKQWEILTFKQMLDKYRN